MRISISYLFLIFCFTFGIVRSMDVISEPRGYISKVKAYKRAMDIKDYTAALRALEDIRTAADLDVMVYPAVRDFLASPRVGLFPPDQVHAFGGAAQKALNVFIKGIKEKIEELNLSAGGPRASSTTSAPQTGPGVQLCEAPLTGAPGVFNLVKSFLKALKEAKDVKQISPILKQLLSAAEPVLNSPVVRDYLADKDLYPADKVDLTEAEIQSGAAVNYLRNALAKKLDQFAAREPEPTGPVNPVMGQFLKIIDTLLARQGRVQYYAADLNRAKTLVKRLMYQPTIDPNLQSNLNEFLSILNGIPEGISTGIFEGESAGQAPLLSGGTGNPLKDRRLNALTKLLGLEAKEEKEEAEKSPQERISSLREKAQELFKKQKVNLSAKKAIDLSEQIIDKLKYVESDLNIEDPKVTGEELTYLERAMGILERLPEDPSQLGATININHYNTIQGPKNKLRIQLASLDRLNKQAPSSKILFAKFLPVMHALQGIINAELLKKVGEVFKNQVDERIKNIRDILGFIDQHINVTNLTQQQRQEFEQAKKELGINIPTVWET